MKLQTNAMKRLARRWKTMPRHERGAATILTVLLIGLGLVSASLGAMHSVRSTQERQLAAHAQVNAQSGVWATVEVVRAYLQTLSKEQLTKLSLNQVWTITGNANLTQQAILVEVVAPIAPADEYKVTAQLTATDIAARSSSSMEVVYEVVPAGAPEVTILNGTLDFYNDLIMSGGITLKTPGTSGMSLNVDGDFDASSISIGGSGLERVAVTGNLTIGSNVNAVELWARNVTVNGGSFARRVKAFGDPDGPGSVGSDAPGDKCCGAIIITGGSGIETAEANGWVKSGGGGVSRIDALRDVEITRSGASHGVITAGGNVTNNNGGTITSSINAVGDVVLANTGMSTGTVYSQGKLTVSASSNIKQAYVVGDVTANGGTLSNLHGGRNVVLNSVTTTRIDAVGNIICDQSYIEYPQLNAGGTITKCQPSWDSKSPRPNHKPNQLITAPVVNIDLMDELPEVKLDRPVINAWALRGQANYAIEVIDGHLMVTVRDVNGVPNDTYYLKPKKATAGNNSAREFLCSGLDNNGDCSEPVAPFCSGQSTQNKCFEFVPGDGESRDMITVLGLRLPPGVVWVKGDLHIQNGVYYNTFIVTGDLTTGGSLKVYALNFAAAYKESRLDAVRKDAVCKNQFATPDALFAGQYPSNFCSNGNFTSKAIGNIGFLAGGYNPDENTSGNTNYSGGKITLGSSNYIYGTVLAGNILKTGGQTYIAGYVSAAGLEQDPDAVNELGQSTEVDLTDTPEGYKPNEIPDMDESSSGTASAATVLWSRYL